MENDNFEYPPGAEEYFLDHLCNSVIKFGRGVPQRKLLSGKQILVFQSNKRRTVSFLCTENKIILNFNVSKHLKSKFFTTDLSLSYRVQFYKFITFMFQKHLNITVKTLEILKMRTKGNNIWSVGTIKGVLCSLPCQRKIKSLNKPLNKV